MAPTSLGVRGMGTEIGAVLFWGAAPTLSTSDFNSIDLWYSFLTLKT
jgi:hypothetical protein